MKFKFSHFFIRNRLLLACFGLRYYFFRKTQFSKTLYDKFHEFCMQWMLYYYFVKERESPKQYYEIGIDISFAILISRLIYFPKLNFCVSFTYIFSRIIQRFHLRCNVHIFLYEIRTGNGLYICGRFNLFVVTIFILKIHEL